MKIQKKIFLFGQIFGIAQLQSLNHLGINYNLPVFITVHSFFFLLPNGQWVGHVQNYYHRFTFCPQVYQPVVQCVPRTLPPNPTLPSDNSITTQSRGVGGGNGRNPTKLRWQTVILQSKLNLESNSMDRFDVFLRPAADINEERAEFQMRKHKIV